MPEKESDPAQIARELVLFAEIEVIIEAKT